jgi:Flp pilus assembly protein TadG
MHSAIRRSTLKGPFPYDVQGGAAVEFALIAPVLFFALLSMVELGVLGMMSASLDHAVIEVSRTIRTGRSDGPVSASSFKDDVCEQMGVGSDCRDRLSVSVQSFDQFSQANAASDAPLEGQFNKGGAGDIVIVKTSYRWPLMTPFVATFQERSGPLEVVLASRAAFKNEPFQ